MLHVVTTPKNALEESLVDQMFTMRATAFHDRRKWRVEVENGREIDAFDKVDPTYVMVSNGSGELLASIRILPSTGPHMLADVFPEVMGENEVVRHPLIWELSRFNVAKKDATVFSPEGVNLATIELLDGVFKHAREAGMSHLISVYDVFVERILKRGGYNFERMGPVVRYDKGLKTLAGMAEVDENIRMRAPKSSVLEAAAA